MLPHSVISSFIDEIFVNFVKQDNNIAFFACESSMALMATFNPQIINVNLHTLDKLAISPSLCHNIPAIVGCL